LRCLFLFRLSL